MNSNNAFPSDCMYSSHIESLQIGFPFVLPHHMMGSSFFSIGSKLLSTSLLCLILKSSSRVCAKEKRVRNLLILLNIYSSQHTSSVVIVSGLYAFTSLKIFDLRDLLYVHRSRLSAFCFTSFTISSVTWFLFMLTEVMPLFFASLTAFIKSTFSVF